jgi:lipopolysaccharide transport system ATP-binding protein
MGDVVIKAEGLGKKYVIGHQAGEGRYVALRDVLAHNVRSMWHKTKDLFRGDVPVQGDSREDIWALRDIDFEIRQGEVVGIIGRNGSGKSTLLKVLSRITEPTEGRVSIRGRVSSLLEVGTGFHPELTGRENIFLNGAILGMTRGEIRGKFDDIVAFAEIEKFLDTPVKRYSSGMYVRLAFAVAAHLEPEILLVDEVLAVGDAAFQSKCIGKMRGVAREGRTVVFVSHDTAAVEGLCTRCFLLDEGQLKLSGTPHEVTTLYLATALQETGRCDIDPKSRKRHYATATMMEVAISSGDGVSVAGINMGSPLAVHVLFRSDAPIYPVLGVVVKTPMGVSLFGINNRTIHAKNIRKVLGEAVITLQFDHPPLMPGKYYLDLYLGDPAQELDVVKEAILFEVFPRDVFGTGKLPHPGAGPIIVPARWELEDRNGNNHFPQRKCNIKKSFTN